MEEFGLERAEEALGHGVVPAITLAAHRVLALFTVGEVQAQLQAGAAKPRRRTTKGRAARSPLAGKLFDETGDRLTPSHTKKKNGQRLRYYVSRRLIQHSGQKGPLRMAAARPMLEQTVVHLIRQHAPH